MRITFISAMRSHPWGGSEDLWSGAARALAAQGHAVSACVHGWPETPAPVAALRAAGVAVHERRRVRASRVARVVARLGGRPAGDAVTEGVRAWLGVQRPELVCVSGGNFSDGLPWMELAVAMGLPLVIVVQANAEFLWPADAAAERLRAVYAAARRVCCVSQRNLELLRDQLALPLPNGEVVWNPFKVSFDAEPAWPGTAEGWKLACVARLEPSAKGQDLLFHVMARPEWKARPVTVSLFGDGPMRKGVERLAAQLGVADRVVVRGHVDSIEAIWREHHALVLPSRYEGLPLALVEAHLCGRPAVVTDVAGNTEMVEEGVTGFVAPAPTVEFLAAALERAWQVRERWPELGREARLRARARVPADPCAAFAARLLSSAA